MPYIRSEGKVERQDAIGETEIQSMGSVGVKERRTIRANTETIIQ